MGFFNTTRPDGEERDYALLFATIAVIVVLLIVPVGMLFGGQAPAVLGMIPWIVFFLFGIALGPFIVVGLIIFDVMTRRKVEAANSKVERTKLNRKANIIRLAWIIYGLYVVMLYVLWIVVTALTA